MSARNPPTEIFIGCAGWSVPVKDRPAALSQLAYYSQLFACVEINSCFYRHHRPQTYARWAAETPAHFRFSLKIPKAVTHTGLTDFATLKRFLDESKELGVKRAILLLQLPPRFEFDVNVVERFLQELRVNYLGKIVCEPRHRTWFTEGARAQLQQFSIEYVLADPAPVENAPHVKTVDRAHYIRLHGAPKIYYSPYKSETLNQIASLLAISTRPWCIFDNTALGHAFTNAQELQKLV
jgi:uncharacterized protein YecE (DUF72 family)